MRWATKRITTSMSVGTGTWVTARVWQSIIVACPAVAAAMQSWSMMPVGTPVAACSARRAASASSVDVPSNPSANPIAHSSAALDDSPAPAGMLLVTSPTRPTVTPSSAAIAAT